MGKIAAHIRSLDLLFLSMGALLFSFFPHIDFWSGDFFLIAPFPDHCLHFPFGIHLNTSAKHDREIYTLLNPTFTYIENLGFAGVYLFFLISDPEHRLWVLSEAVLSCTHNQCFVQKY